MYNQSIFVMIIPNIILATIDMLTKGGYNNYWLQSYGWVNLCYLTYCVKISSFLFVISLAKSALNYVGLPVDFDVCPFTSKCTSFKTLSRRYQGWQVSYFYIVLLMVMLLRLPQPGISFLCHVMYFDIITSGKKWLSRKKCGREVKLERWSKVNIQNAFY